MENNINILKEFIKIYLDCDIKKKSLKQTLNYFSDNNYLYVYKNIVCNNLKTQFDIEYKCLKNQYYYGDNDEDDELVLKDFHKILEKI